MLKVCDLMSTILSTLKDTDSLQNARTLMEQRRIRHIPIVTDDNVFIGLITHRDVLAATISQLAEVDPQIQREIEAGIPLHEIMRTDVLTVGTELPLLEAASILFNHKYGCLPVVDGDKLVGILTEADFVKLTIQLLETMDG